MIAEHQRHLQLYAQPSAGRLTTSSAIVFSPRMWFGRAGRKTTSGRNRSQIWHAHKVCHEGQSQSQEEYNLKTACPSLAIYHAFILSLLDYQLFHTSHSFSQILISLLSFVLQCLFLNYTCSYQWKSPVALRAVLATAVRTPCFWRGCLKY